MMYQKYDAYKDSGVEWLGEIPKDWYIVRLKNISRVNPSNTSYIKNINDEVCFLPMEAVETNGQVNFENKRIIKLVKNGFTSFIRNDVLVAKITPCFENGKGALLNKMPTVLGFGSTEFHVLRAKNNIAPRFLYYITKSHGFMVLGEALMIGSAGQKRVPTDFVQNFNVALPSNNEQENIIAFLDQKTAQIDQAIAIKEQQIALLNERKQIVIQQAVTKGLDPNVKMKDSGVEWIGQIPEHWTIKKLKYVLSERSDRSIKGDEPLLMMSQIYGLVVRSDFHDKAEIASTNVGNKLVYCNDLVFNKLKAHLGVFFSSTHTFIGSVSPDYAVYYCKNYIENSKFLEILFRNPLFIKQFIIRSTGVVEGLIRLYTSELFELKIAIPPVEEQKKILDFVEMQSNHFDEALSLLNKQIQKLKEYKTTLINDAVTGKIKVA